MTAAVKTKSLLGDPRIASVTSDGGLWVYLRPGYRAGHFHLIIGRDEAEIAEQLPRIRDCCCCFCRQRIRASRS